MLLKGFADYAYKIVEKILQINSLDANIKINLN